MHVGDVGKRLIRKELPVRKTFYRTRTLCAAVVLCVIACQASPAQVISNGGFEINAGAGATDFADWTVVNQIPGGDSFFVQTGTGTPLFGQLVPPPPEGNFAAMTDSGGSGSHLLYQEFSAPIVFSTARISFQLFVNNQAGDFVAPGTLDSTGGDNQQARVDLLLAGSDPFSVVPGDVLLNLFQTNPGDPLTSGYTLVDRDITSIIAAHGGAMLRLRFSEVDTLAPLNFGVDDVRLNVVPEPTSTVLLGSLAAVGAGLMGRRWRSLRAKR